MRLCVLFSSSPDCAKDDWAPSCCLFKNWFCREGRMSSFLISSLSSGRWDEVNEFLQTSKARHNLSAMVSNYYGCIISVCDYLV